MENFEVKSVTAPDTVRQFEHGKVEVCNIGSHTIGRVEFEPGWHWSTSIKPIVGTDWCQTTHIGYVIEGNLGVRMQDGTEFQLKAGDAYRVDPGHDAWVEGGGQYKAVEFETLTDYAKPKS
ncbi:MAG: cupin domain-containing protein [Candidatus Dormibacteria bacterium]